MNDSRNTTTTGSTAGTRRDQPDAQDARCTPGRTRCRAPRRAASPGRGGGPTSRRRCRRPRTRRTPPPAGRGRRTRTAMAPSSTASDGADQGDDVGHGADGPAGDRRDEEREGLRTGLSSWRRRSAGRGPAERPGCRPVRAADPGPGPAGTEVPNPRRGPASPAVGGDTGCMRRRAAPADDPHLLRRRRTARGGAAAVLAGRVASASAGEDPVAFVAALRDPGRRRAPRCRAGGSRSTILAVGAGFVAIWTPARPSALARRRRRSSSVSVAEDPRGSRGSAGSCGLAGSIGALVALSPTTATVVAASSAVALGGGLGLLLRSRFTEQQLDGRGPAAARPGGLARAAHQPGPRAARRGGPPRDRDGRAGRGRADGDPQAALRNIGDLGRTALGELDALVVHLRDPESAAAVTAPPRLLDIDELLAAPLRGQGVQVEVRIDAELGLDEVEVLTVYRIAQEALTNVTRHAQARNTWVELTRSTTGSACGSATTASGRHRTPTAGSGLLGIEERVTALGGTLGPQRATGWRDHPRREHPGGPTDDPGRGGRRPGLVRDGFAMMIAAQPDMEVAVSVEDGQQFLDAVRARPAHRRRAGRHPDAGPRRPGRHPRPGRRTACARRRGGDHVRRRRLRAGRDRGRCSRVPAQAVQRPRARRRRTHRRLAAARSSPPR